MALINCSECGKLVSSKAISCPNCGNPISSETTSLSLETNSQQITTRDERNGTIIYLKDICCLETIINSLNSKIQELNNSINNICNNNYYKSYNHEGFYRPGKMFASPACLMFYYDGENYYFTEWRKKQQLSVFGPWDNVSKKNQLLTPELLEELEKPTTKGRGFFRSYDKTSWWGNFEVYIDPEKCRELFISDFSDFKSIAPTEYMQNLAKIKELSTEKQKLEEEYEVAVKLLEKEYNLNIIPTKFRSLEAVYYIYDYFVSSNEKLSNILLQLNLDEIKSKIDTIIQNQQTIILNQSIQIAQNEALLAQNQKTLKLLTSIATDSAETLKWTQIAANNAEVAAWIGAANYISNNL